MNAMPMEGLAYASLLCCLLYQCPTMLQDSTAVPVCHEPCSFHVHVYMLCHSLQDVVHTYVPFCTRILGRGISTDDALGLAFSLCCELLKTKVKKKQTQKILEPFLDLCVSSLREGHANLLCIVPILTDVTEVTSGKPDFWLYIHKHVMAVASMGCKTTYCRGDMLATSRAQDL